MAPISPSASSFLLPINRRGSFFEDAYFQDAREDFHNAVRDVLTRRDRGRGSDKKRDLSCYRRLRQQEDFDEDSQALTITEDENNRKILLDVKEFHPDGDVKVHAVSDQELLVEGRHQDPNTGRVRSFSRRFMLPWYADLSCGFFSVDISSDGVLRIVTTKKAPSTGRSIPLILDYQEIKDNDSHQESYINTDHNSNISSNNRNVSFSMNGNHEEAFNHTKGNVNSNSESVYCSSQQDTMREVPQNHKRGKIIPVVLVKSETNEESNKFAQSSSLTQESAALTNQKGSIQYSTNQTSSSSTSTNKIRPVKTVITTTFDVKPNSNEDIPAKHHEIVIPINIESKTSGQRTDREECTKQKQPHRNIPVSNGISSTNNPVNRNVQNEDLSSKNSKVKRIIPVTVEKKKDKTKDADSSKIKTAPKKCFTILNKKSKTDTSDKHKKDMTKDSKRNTYPKEFIIPLTIEGDSLDEKPVQKEAVKKVEFGRQDQSKKNNGNKPPINQNKKPTSPQPKRINISNIFMGQNDQKKEIKSTVSSDNNQSNRSESANNKPPPSPRSSIDRKHNRSSSIEERLSKFTKMSSATERKSRRDFMDEIRGNGRGARSRSSSIEELIVKFDKMSPQAERRVLNRKNSREENTENFEKKQVVKGKESIIPIEIELDTEKSDSVSKQNCSEDSYSNNNATGLYDITSQNEKLNRMEENENKENSNSQVIKPIVKRRESIIPIKLEYEEDDDNSFTAPISEGSFSVDATTRENNDFTSDYSKVSNDGETENGNIYASTPSINSITKETSDTESSPCIFSDSASDKYSKINNDDRFSSISSSSIIEDDNAMVSADEDSKKTPMGKTKKSSKRKVKRKQSIPGVQVSDDETGETTVLLSGRSSSATGKKKQIPHYNSSLAVKDSNSSSSLNVSVEACNKNEGTVDSLTGFSSENISNTSEASDNIGKEMSSNIPEVKDLTNYSEPNGTNSSNLLLQKEQSNTYNLINSMSDSPISKPDSYDKNSLTKTVHDYSNLSDKCNESPRKGKVYRRTSVSQLVSDDSGSEGSGASSLHQSRSKFRESRVSVKLSSKIRSDKSPTNDSTNNKTYTNCSDVRGNTDVSGSTDISGSTDVSGSTDIEKLTPNAEVISNDTSFEISDENVSSEKRDTENNKSKISKGKSNEKMDSRRSSVLPSPSDLLKIKLPKKNKKEKSETNESSKANKVESNKNEKTEQNSINSKESRRASVLPNPSDLLKIKPPKKSVLERNASSKKSVSSENSENSKSSQDIQQPKDKPTESEQKQNQTASQLTQSSKSIHDLVTKDNLNTDKSSQDIQQPKEKPSASEQQQNQTDSQQTQTSKNTHDLVTKDNLNTDKDNDKRVLENISENTLTPEAINNTDNSTTNLEPPTSPSLRRKTSFKKFKVFENKRTSSPSPIRRPDSLTPPKTEQFIINKIEENSTSKKEETNNKKEENSLIKKEPLSSSKISRINVCVNIENKDMFFSDPFFKDHRQLFMGGVREALKRSGITSMRDKLRVYRELRLKDHTEDNQAICSAEDETSYKAVFDMSEFLEGEIKVKTASSTEIVIEAISKSGNKSTPFSHSLPFPDSINMEAVEAALSEDGILAISAPKTNPDTEV